MTLPWDELAEQFVLRPFIELPVHRQLAGAIVDAIKLPEPLLTVIGPSGVGKSSGVWWAVRALQQVNPAWSWCCLLADEEMTPDRCCDRLEEATHLVSDRWYRGTPTERFERLQHERQLTCLMIDEADQLPPPTVRWLRSIPLPGQVMVGLISNRVLTSYPQHHTSDLPHRLPFVFPPFTTTDLVYRIGPPLSQVGWFIERRGSQYWTLCGQLQRLSGGSLRRLWQILFTARWVACDAQETPLRIAHIQSAITAWEARGRNTPCLPVAR